MSNADIRVVVPDWSEISRKCEEFKEALDDMCRSFNLKSYPSIGTTLPCISSATAASEIASLVESRRRMYKSVLKCSDEELDVYVLSGQLVL